MPAGVLVRQTGDQPRNIQRRRVKVNSHDISPQGRQAAAHAERRNSKLFQNRLNPGDLFKTCENRTSALSGGLACLPTGCGRGIRSIEVRKVGFGMTVCAMLYFPVLLKTEVVIAEASPFSVSWDAEDYPRALAASELHGVLLCVLQRRLHLRQERRLLARAQRGSPNRRAIYPAWRRRCYVGLAGG